MVNVKPIDLVETKPFPVLDRKAIRAAHYGCSDKTKMNLFIKKMNQYPLEWRKAFVKVMKENERPYVSRSLNVTAQLFRTFQTFDFGRKGVSTPYLSKDEIASVYAQLYCALPDDKKEIVNQQLKTPLLSDKIKAKYDVIRQKITGRQRD